MGVFVHEEHDHNNELSNASFIFAALFGGFKFPNNDEKIEEPATLVLLASFLNIYFFLFFFFYYNFRTIIITTFLSFTKISVTIIIT
jgi:hypothetical protein